MNKISFTGMCVAAIVMAGIAVDACAQFPGGGFPGGGGRSSRGDYPAGGRGGEQSRPGGPRAKAPMEAEDAADRVDNRLERLREDLQLRDDQQAAWKAYADRVLAFADDITRQRVHDQATNEQGPVERLDNIIDGARNRLTALEDIAVALKALYPTLTAEQKQLAASRLITLIPMASGGLSSFASGAQRARPTP